MDIDLDLNNYDLDDLLNLFKIPYDFGEKDLKNAKKIVLKTHPDKSNLSKNYFLFFSKAYKVLYQIYSFRNHTNKQTEYVVDEKDEGKELLLGRIKSNKNFNELFNEMFEKNRIHDESNDTGYGDWFKSDDDVENSTLSFTEMNKVVEDKKSSLKSLIVHKDIEDMGNSSHYDLSRDRPSEYSADVFSKLNYEDLKKAHTETVVPVTHEDYVNKKKFSSEEEMRSFRNNQETKPLSFEQSKKYLSNRDKLQTDDDVKRAYKLAKHDELVRDVNDKWWGQLKRITE